MMREGHELNEELWEFFCEFAENNGISLEVEEDWGAWWDCFAAGFDAANEMRKEGS